MMSGRLLACTLASGLLVGAAENAESPLPRPATADWLGEANQAFAAFGTSVAAAGDVNGDGYADVIVGASGFTNGQTNEGRAFVFYGSATGLPAIPNWSVEGDQQGASFGDSVAGAGDVNGDGYDDVIVGAGFYDHGQLDEGRAFVYHGSSAGLATTPAWTAEANQPSAGVGYSARGAGVVNGDGYDDVIVGAMAYDNGQLDEGRAYVYLGSPRGLRPEASWIAEGNQAGTQGGCTCFGYSVATAGDVNGDGYDDVVVGAPFYDRGQNNEGSAFLYLGSPNGPRLKPAWRGEANQSNAYFGRAVGAAGDVNGDGYGDVIVGANLYDDGQQDEGVAFVYHGSAAGLSPTHQWKGQVDSGGVWFGSAVGTAGDSNGDGFDDVVVGAPNWGVPPSTGGAAFAYLGSASGLATSPAWMGVGEGTYVAAQYGGSVGTAGDVNGDGFMEIVVGAQHETHGQFFEGVAYGYNGPLP
jgi:hypothetical protein